MSVGTEVYFSTLMGLLEFDFVCVHVVLLLEDFQEQFELFDYSDIREVTRFYNLGDKSFETDFSFQSLSASISLFQMLSLKIVPSRRENENWYQDNLGIEKSNRLGAMGKSMSKTFQGGDFSFRFLILLVKKELSNFCISNA